MTVVSELLREGVECLRAAASETPRLDAELLLGHAVGMGRSAILAHPEAPVGVGPAELYRAALARRERGEPVAYIRGFKEFHGLAIATDSRALIPRPETELLVGLAERELVTLLTSGARPRDAPAIRVADVGTGSGAVAVAVAAALRRRGMLGEVEIVATDRSPDAVMLARENAVAHAVADRVTVVEADLLPSGDAAGRFRLVLANLPYIPTTEIDGLPVAASFEPRSALDGGPDGLEVIRRLLALLSEALDDRGVAFLEIGADQERAIAAAAAEQLPGWGCHVSADLSGLPRVARVERIQAAGPPRHVGGIERGAAAPAGGGDA